MEDIEIKLMALFILTKGPSLVKISFIWGRGLAPQNLFLPRGPRNFEFGMYYLEPV